VRRRRAARRGDGLPEGADASRPQPSSIAKSLAIGNRPTLVRPADRPPSGGALASVSDDEIVEESASWPARGHLRETAGGVTIATLARWPRRAWSARRRVVRLRTGHGSRPSTRGAPVGPRRRSLRKSSRSTMRSAPVDPRDRGDRRDRLPVRVRNPTQLRVPRTAATPRSGGGARGGHRRRRLAPWSARPAGFAERIIDGDAVCAAWNVFVRGETVASCRACHALRADQVLACAAWRRLLSTATDGAAGAGCPPRRDWVSFRP